MKSIALWVGLDVRNESISGPCSGESRSATLRVQNPLLCLVAVPPL